MQGPWAARIKTLFEECVILLCCGLLLSFYSRRLASSVEGKACCCERGLRISDMGFCILLAASTTNGSLSTRIINLIVLPFLLLATNKRMTTVMESRHEL